MPTGNSNRGVAEDAATLAAQTATVRSGGEQHVRKRQPAFGAVLTRECHAFRLTPLDTASDLIRQYLVVPHPAIVVDHHRLHFVRDDGSLDVVPGKLLDRTQ